MYRYMMQHYIKQKTDIKCRIRELTNRNPSPETYSKDHMIIMMWKYLFYISVMHKEDVLQLSVKKIKNNSYVKIYKGLYQILRT